MNSIQYVGPSEDNLIRTSIQCLNKNADGNLLEECVKQEYGKVQVCQAM